MATATLFINTSDVKRLNKTTSKAREVTIQYKDDTSVVTPTIKLDNFANVFKVNYVYLSDFGRYYFITDRTVSQQHVYLTLKEDVRYTWRDYIKKCRAIIKRQENIFNTYLDDENFKALEYSRVQTFSFPYGFNTNAFILTIAGGR